MITYFQILKAIITALIFPALLIFGLAVVSKPMSSINTRNKVVLHLYLNLALCIIGFSGIILILFNPSIAIFSFGLAPLFAIIFVLVSLSKFRKLINYILDKKDLL